MSTRSSLLFQTGPFTIAMAVVSALATAAFGYIAWRRSGYRRTIGLLELLRLSIVIAAGLLFNQPEWVKESRPTSKPVVAVLWDNSVSMQTRDVVANGKPGAPAQRSESIKPLTEPGFWSELADRYEVVLTPFSSAAGDTASDLHTPLSDAISQHGQLRAVVLVSDGDWNTGAPPVDAATRFRLRETPVFAIPVGSAIRLPDVELVSLDAPTFGIAGKQVRIPITIESSLPQDYVTSVRLETSSGETVEKQVLVGAMSRSTDTLVWKPEQTGDYTLKVVIPEHNDEQILTNNTRTAPIAIREEKLRVLVVESYPRWEYRYLRNALSRDPGVEVSCLLFHPGLTKQGGGNADYIKEFPSGLDELSKFDVVFIGDVGCSGDQLTAEQCRLIKGLVEHQASGLIVMPGWQGRQVSLLDTELADLYPVQLDVSRPEGWGARTPNHFQLTETGRRSLLTKLADTRDENAEIWADLPGFQWYAPVLRARAGSEVLCVHESASNQYGRLPLLATRTFGAGKVLFMGSDGAWRWRKGVEDKYHYRFWSQVIRWMAYQRNMARGETMRLYYSPDQPLLRQTLTINANVMENSGEPLADGEVVARITAPSGKAETIRFQSTGQEWGAFSGRFTSSEPGKHTVALSAKPTGGLLETSFYVQGDLAEKIGQPARIEVLEEIARVSRGQTITIDNADDAINRLTALPDPPAAIRRLQLWSNPFVAASIVTLLGVFWVLRKAVGLI
ncbi:hypothetical protein Pla123a_19310 [Posidoniimonas polymericola]|uniref:Glutamine amidotransferase domain-containing protein n=1 Tax=Posidoniimonas polymericola TaxID=2528002 RepID=A0A5C5YQR6_9BACT|nr:hypothetical protein [Posidoniimonas polymericola]TWT77274.1 hypothetical protein Pla123a_19310 [Posidoniimonas polymericola]